MAALLAAARRDLTRGRPAPSYRPGSCNIGDEQIARRRRWGHASLAAGLALFVLLLAVDAPREWRTLLFLPAAGSAIGYLQARVRFCAAFGLAAVFDLGRTGGGGRVTDPAAVARDRRRALELIAASTLVGLGVALAATLL